MRELDEFDWARSQTCAALARNADVHIAKLFASVKQLPLHKDKWKNWDNFLAVHHANRLCAPDEHILDAGACRDPSSPSVFLPSMKKLGFELLHGCNLDEPEIPEPDGGTCGTMEDDIYYTRQNIEKTRYPQDYFGFVACLSTIEHGVHWGKYFAEMSRIIKPGGYLFTSFDYWKDPIDTKGQQAFGVPITIFDQTNVMNMCVYAASIGLLPLKKPDLSCKERPVQWMGMDYTFFNLLMRKEA